MNIKRLLFGPTVIEFAWHWQQTSPRGDVSRHQLIGFINNYLVPYWGDRRIRSITSDEVRHFRDSLRNRRGLKTKQPLKELSMWSILKDLRALLNYAVKEGVIKKNPADGIRIRMSLPPVKYYTAEHVRTLLDAPYPDDHHLLAVNLALFAGLRRGEILALTWDDVDLDKRLLYIRHSKNIIDGKEYIKLPKSGKARVEPMNDTLFSLLSRYYTVPGNNVVTLKPWQLTGWFPEFAKGLGIPPYNFHVLRKTFGTLLLQSGVDIKTVSLLLGHSGVQVTYDAYIGIVQDGGLQAVNHMLS